MTPQDAALLASLTGFTPGPWDCHFSNDAINCDCKYVMAEYGGMGSIATIDVCEAMDGPWGDDYGPDVASAKANAALLIAAPDLHRIATERAAEIERLLEALEAIRQYGNDTLSGPSVASEDTRNWQREGVLEMTKRAANAIEAKP